METLKLAYGNLATLVERAHAAHQVGDLLIVKVMTIAPPLTAKTTFP